MSERAGVRRHDGLLCSTLVAEPRFFVLLCSRTAELARVFGIDFSSVLTRGSQYRVESMLLRLARTQDMALPSPAKAQVRGLYLNITTTTSTTKKTSPSNTHALKLHRTEPASTAGADTRHATTIPRKGAGKRTSIPI